MQIDEKANLLHSWKIQVFSSPASDLNGGSDLASGMATIFNITVYRTGSRFTPALPCAPTPPPLSGSGTRSGSFSASTGAGPAP